MRSISEARIHGGSNVATALPLIREGKLRGLAVASLKPVQSAPELPTMDRSGFPGFQADAWFGLVAAAGTPAPIVARLHVAPFRRSRRHRGIVLLPLEYSLTYFAAHHGGALRTAWQDNVRQRTPPCRSDGATGRGDGLPSVDATTSAAR
jgi:hypothetical protein